MPSAYLLADRIIGNSLQNMIGDGPTTMDRPMALIVQIVRARKRNRKQEERMLERPNLHFFANIVRPEANHMRQPIPQMSIKPPPPLRPKP
jgi:hypothetical protein